MKKDYEIDKRLKNDIRLLTEDEAKEQLYQVTFELWRYQDMVQEILEFIGQHKFTERANYELFNIIKKWETK